MEEFSSSSSASIPSLPPSMRAVIVSGNGSTNDSLSIGTVSSPSLSSSTSIIIKISSFGINRADISQRQGSYPPPPGASTILGLECSGVIISIGDRCNKKWMIGQRVMALLSGGGYAEYAEVDEGSIIPLPDSFSFEKGAAISEAFLTAYQLLSIAGVNNNNNNNIDNSDIILIHAAASGVGLAAIQIATKVFGATVIGTSRSSDKFSSIIAAGAKGVIDWGIEEKRHERTVEEIKRITGGKKSTVDVILDCVGSNYFDANFQIIGLDGRWVQYAFMSGSIANNINMRLLLGKRIQWTGTTLRNRSIDYKTKLVTNFQKEIMPKIVDGTLEIIIEKIFKIDEIKEAHQMMEQNKNIGKIIVSW